MVKDVPAGGARSTIPPLARPNARASANSIWGSSGIEGGVAWRKNKASQPHLSAAWPPPGVYKPLHRQMPYGRFHTANAEGAACVRPREPDRPGHPEGRRASTETFKNHFIKPLHSLRGSE